MKKIFLIALCCVCMSNYVNMEDVVKVETTQVGTLLTFADGTGYYIEY